ncbi:MAG: hypothetical protein ACK55Z_20780, partial [bacterium]
MASSSSCNRPISFSASMTLPFQSLSSAAAAQNSHPPSQPARFTTKNSTTQQKKDPHRPTLDIRVTRQDCAGECTE